MKVSELLKILESTENKDLNVVVLLDINDTMMATTVQTAGVEEDDDGDEMFVIDTGSSPDESDESGEENAPSTQKSN